MAHQSSISDKAHKLRAAMKGFFNDDNLLTDVVSSLDVNDIAPLVTTYSKEIGRDLLEDIKSETSGAYEDSLVALLTPQVEYDANLLRKAMKGLGTDENVLIEVLCTRTSDELKDIAACFLHKYGHNLEDDISSEVGGDLKHLLIRRLKSVGGSDMENDLQLLYNAGQNKIGTDETVFVNVLGGRTKEYIHQLSDAYANKYGKALSAVCESELSGDLKNALLALVKANPDYFSEKLHKAFAGAGTDEATVIRIIASQRFHKLKHIAVKYLHRYEQALADRIRDEFSGDSKKVLAAIVTRSIQ